MEKQAPARLPSGVSEARRGLIRAGFGAPLSASAPAPGGPDQQRAHLAEIARYIKESDPAMIGAAWLLEQCGCERGQRSLLDQVE